MNCVYIFKTFFTFEEIASKGFRLLEGMLHMLLARLRIFNFVSSLKFLSFNWLVFILKILGFSSCNIQLFLESTEQHLIIFSRTLLFSRALTYNSKNSRLCRFQKYILHARDIFIFTVKKISYVATPLLPGHVCHHVKVHKLTRIEKNYICNLIYTKKSLKS